MAVSLEFIQSQLKAIQTDLREMRFAADVDRRNTASLYNNLTAEVGAAIGGLDAKVELGFEVVNERIDRLEEKVDRLGERSTGWRRRSRPVSRASNSFSTEAEPAAPAVPTCAGTATDWRRRLMTDDIAFLPASSQLRVN